MPTPPGTQGKPERRTIQSVAVHLIGLYLSLERGTPAGDLPRARQAVAACSAQFCWLEPPSERGEITVRDVHAAGTNPDAHSRLVRDWAESAWQAWAAHHAQIRAWTVPVIH